MIHKFESVNLVLKVSPPLTGEEDNPLKLSIQKWERVVELLEVNGHIIDSCGEADTCALCARHLRIGCNGCPVCTTTGQNFCHGTPYDCWNDAWLVDNFSMMLAAAKDMVKFLKSLEKEER